MAENLLLKYLKRTPRVTIEKLPDSCLPVGPASDVVVKKEKTENENKPQPVQITIAPAKSNNTTNLTTNLLKDKTPTENGKPSVPAPPPVPEETAIDYSSICGKFGWVPIGDDHLPVILRGDKQFVAVRIFESEIISKYTKILPWHVFTSTNIKSYYITESEAKLLNEINEFHSERRFGYIVFTVKDVVVTLLDATRFQEYLNVCKYKLYPEKAGFQERYRSKCGLLHISRVLTAPYIRKKGIKYVPEAFLNGGTIICSTTTEMEDWDVAYLKFVCHVSASVYALDAQKIKVGSVLHPINELRDYLSGQSVVVEERQLTGMNSVDYNGSSNTTCDWSKMQSSRPHTIGSAINQMPLARPSNSENVNTNNWITQNSPKTVGDILGSVRRIVNKSNNAEQTIVARQDSSGYCTSSNSTDKGMVKYLMRQPGNENNLFPPPPPLIRSSRQMSSQLVNSAGSSDVILGRPPPLQSSVSVADLARSNAMSNFIANGVNNVSQLNGYSGLSDPTFLSYSNGSSKSVGRIINGSIDDQRTVRRLPNMVVPPHHYPTPPQSSPHQASTTPTPVSTPLSMLDPLMAHQGLLSHSDLIDLCSPPPSPDSRKLLSSYGVSNMTHGTSHQITLPHVLQRVEIDGKIVPVTNLEPYKLHSTYVTNLSSVQKQFFPNTTLQSCQFVLKNVLGVKLYAGSGLILMTLCQGSSLTADALVSVTDLQCYLPHLTYMFQNKTLQSECSSNVALGNAKKAKLDYSVANN